MGNSLIHFQDKSLWIQYYHLEPIIFFISKPLTEVLHRKEIESEHIL